LKNINTYVALFRGINVGGKSLLPMKDLVAILANLGALSIHTTIQSGNAIFQSHENDISKLSSQISLEVQQHSGFTPTVLILKFIDIENAMAENPFREAEADPSNLYLGFLASTPEKTNLQELDALKKESEHFYLANRVFYLYAPEGVGRSKLVARCEKILGVPMTDRNWNTVCKIREIAARLHFPEDSN
jgi:uncharacterized protein (DUF1697 family)